MKIRPFTRRDISAMVTVAKKFPEGPEPTAIDLYYQRGFAAADGKKIVGFITCFSDQGIPQINQLRIDPNLRRRGIGTRLVAAAENEARKAGSDILQVTVMGWTRPFNPAFSGTREFYRALGFKVAKKHPMHVEGEDHWRYYTLEKRLSRTRRRSLRRVPRRN